MMKFNLNNEVEESVLQDNPDLDPDYNRTIDPDYAHTMSSENKLSGDEGNESEGQYIMETFKEFEGPSDPLGEVEEPKTTRRKTTGRPYGPYPKRFRAEWLNYTMFRGWLKPHPNPMRAMCMACNCVINCGKSELEKHATSIKHQKKVGEFRRISGNFDLAELAADGQTVEQDDEIQGADPEASDGAYESSSMIHLDMSQQSTSHGQSRSKPSAEVLPYQSKAIVTKPAPPWRATAIVNGHVTRLELSDYKGRYLVLFFYPQDFSAVCPTELHALSDRIAEFRAIQTEVVACSVDSHLTHLAWARLPRGEGGLGNPKIPLLADPTHSIARDYGVLLPDMGHSLRAHFVIDRRGILRHSLVNDISVGRSIDEILRVTQALQHVDDTETGCPADWKPGEPTI